MTGVAVRKATAEPTAQFLSQDHALNFALPVHITRQGIAIFQSNKLRGCMPFKMTFSFNLDSTIHHVSRRQALKLRDGCINLICEHSLIST